MLTRPLAILIGTWLPTLALILPIGPAHTTNALIAGSLATLLSVLSLTHERFRVATAVVGGWVALSPFVIWSTLIEQVLLVSWGTTMFVWMAGPFSASPKVTRTRLPAREAPPVEEMAEKAEEAEVALALPRAA